MVQKHRWSPPYRTNLNCNCGCAVRHRSSLRAARPTWGIASTAFAARDWIWGIVVVRDACYSMRGNNNEFFMERVFPRMGRVMTVDEAVVDGNEFA